MKKQIFMKVLLRAAEWVHWSNAQAFLLHIQSKFCMCA